MMSRGDFIGVSSKYLLAADAVVSPHKASIKKAKISVPPQAIAIYKAAV
jgi:hypothetical protein